MGFSHKKLKWSCPEQEQILEQKSYDRFTSLPIDILMLILSFLNITEVVKTSLLSKKWRFIWSSIPCLNFDFRAFWNQDHCLALRYDECLSKFWAFVKWTIVIRGRDASPINNIKFFCDYFDAYQLEFLISLCSMRSVQELDLFGGYEIRDCPFYHVLAQSIEAMKQNLYNLAGLQPFTGFGNLKTLHLVRVRFPDANITEKLFSDCGVLEDLYLEYCCFMMIKFLNICANKLQKLHFINIGPNWCRSKCRLEGALKLHTPNLVSFCYIGTGIQFCEYSDMLFLKHALIRVYSDDDQFVPCEELGSIVSAMHHVKELTISSVFALYFFIGGSCSNFRPFGCLSRLKLEVECNANKIEGLINLLQNSPILEFLSIKLSQSWPRTNWKSREVYVPCLSHTLKEVEACIVAYSDMPESLEVIKFFLQNGKALQRIKIIQKNKKMKSEKFYALQEVQLASEAVSVSVASTSASGKMELTRLLFEKCGLSVQTQNRKLKIKIRRSVRIAAKKPGSSS